MNFEEMYYENDKFWNYEASEKTINRIKETYSLIPDDVESVLDVGCGNGVFINYLLDSQRSFKKLHGTDRSNSALKYVKTQNTKASIDKLPFEDNSFDLVVCLEVIEHLPLPIYKKALDEISRITKKYIIVSVPNNEDIDKTLIRCNSCRTLFNPDYHFRSFDRIKLENLFKKNNCTAMKVQSYGERIQYLLPTNPFTVNSVKARNNPFPMDILCPVCGFEIPGNTNVGENISKKKSVNIKFLLKQVIKLFIPKKVSPSWLAGLYIKNGK